LEPDVVTLQEVAIMTVDGDVTDQAARLAESTGFAARYGAVHSFPLVEPENGRSIGSAMWGHAILTRRPIQRPFTRGLPRAGDDDLVEPADSDRELAGVRYADTQPGHREARCVVGGVLSVGGGAGLTVATAHLTYIGREQRRKQADAARAVADEAAGERPLVLTGDLNAAIDAPELAGMTRGLVDAFAAVGVEPGDARRDSCGSQPIDHVLVRGAAVESCRVALEAGDLSDHWPVVAELALD
jgi:endonuclease/exonuclease/phosphatase family metal-dependent hydrolase